MRTLTGRLLDGGHLHAREVRNPLVVLLRLLAVPLVNAAVRFRIAPNAITVSSILLGLVAAGFYERGLAGAFLGAWTLSVILDYTDGGVARRLEKATYAGYLLDMLGDRLKLLALLVAWGATQEGGLGVALAFSVGTVLLLDEVVSHLLIPVRMAHWPRWWRAVADTPVYLVAVDFDMHSFLLFGVAIALVSGVSPAFWLLLVLTIHLWGTASARVGRRSWPVPNRTLLQRWRGVR